MTLSIRLATVDDVSALATLMTEFYAEANFALPASAAAHTFEALFAASALGMGHMRVLFRHCHDTAWPVRLRRPDFEPQALSWIIERCMAKNPLERPESFDLLKSWIDHAFADPAWNPAQPAKTTRSFVSMLDGGSSVVDARFVIFSESGAI